MQVPWVVMRARVEEFETRRFRVLIGISLAGLTEDYAWAHRDEIDWFLMALIWKGTQESSWSGISSLIPGRLLTCSLATCIG
jgi:hypothetical protein